MADRIDAAAHAAFRKLVVQDGFADWFARSARSARSAASASAPGRPSGADPGLSVGFRSGRGAAPAMDLADLQAIPWVFAWSRPG